MKKLRKISGSDIRLLLAAVLCVAVLIGTDSSGTCDEKGTLNIQNDSDFTVNVSYTGGESGSANLGSGASTSRSVKVGMYNWAAVVTGIIGGQSTNGSCKVSKDTPGNIVVNF